MRRYFEIVYLSDDSDNVESLELSGDYFTFFFGRSHFIVTCDGDHYSFDLDQVVSFRYVDRFNTQLADYL